MGIMYCDCNSYTIIIIIFLYLPVKGQKLMLKGMSNKTDSIMEEDTKSNVTDEIESKVSVRTRQKCM